LTYPGNNTDLNVRPWPEVQAIIPRLSAADRQSLADSIAANGVRVAIMVLPDGRIIDGVNRWELSKGRAPVEVLDMPEDQAFELALTLNEARRHLGPEQLAAVRQKKREHRASRKAQSRELRRQGATQQQAAEAAGVHKATVSRWEENGESELQEEEVQHTFAPDLRLRIPPGEREVIHQRVQAGETREQVAADYRVTAQRIGQVVRLVESREQVEADRARRAEEGRKALGDNPRTVHPLDFREFAPRLADGSVSLIFTDPPYNRASGPLTLYGDLARVAKRVLRPGGSLLCYCGHYLLRDILNVMAQHLDFYWCCACIHSGRLAVMREYGIKPTWKPIAWFTNGPRAVPERHVLFADGFSGGREKAAHDWQQAEAEAAHFIENLTRPGELVFDPFAGSGTTAVAALSLGRLAAACDRVSRNCDVAEERIAASAPTA
jgi:16S rRNA G966 N2-methylase RsmD/DNA-binding XRE family transcriptional regulator